MIGLLVRNLINSMMGTRPRHQKNYQITTLKSNDPPQTQQRSHVPSPNLFPTTNASLLKKTAVVRFEGPPSPPNLALFFPLSINLAPCHFAMWLARIAFLFAVASPTFAEVKEVWWNLTYVTNANPDGLYERRVVGVNGSWP